MDVILKWVELHPGLASWVQAIGSIAALILAFAIVFVQQDLSVRNERKAEGKARLAVIFALRKLALELRDKLNEALAVSMAEYEFFAYRTTCAALSDYEKIFQLLPVAQLLMHGLSIQYLGLRSIARESSQDFVVEHGSDGVFLRSDPVKLKERLEQCTRFIREIENVASAKE